jgi:FkbM family methyltransferase
MGSISILIQNLFHALGYHITRYYPNVLSSGPLSDIKRMVSVGKRPVIFDVGANKGQSIKDFKNVFPHCSIHSFEPSPATYKDLVRNVSRYSDVFLNNLAVGSSCGEKLFIENSNSDMSSFLQPGKYCWGEIIREIPVELTTLDKYCDDNDIRYINILKTDTQGYDLEVLKGAKDLIVSKRIQIIFIEVNFCDMYKGSPPFYEIFRFLTDNHFKLVSFYNFNHIKNVAGWADALFLNPDY